MDEQAWGFTVADCDRALCEGEPRIEVLTSTTRARCLWYRRADNRPQRLPRRADRIQIISMTLKDGEELIIGRGLKEILSKVSLKKKT